MISIGSVIAGAFRLFREQPVALLIWWALATMVAAATGLAILQVMSPSAAPPTPEAAIFSLLAVFLPVYLFGILISVVQSAAAFRAVMRPYESMAGFLRVGMDELRVLGMGALWTIALLIFYFILAAFAFIVGDMLGGMRGVGSSLGLLLILLVLLSPIWGGMIFFHVRLSPALPLTILRRTFVIGEAWRATKGQFWPLFAAYLVVTLLILALYIFVFALLSGPVWAALVSGISPTVARGAWGTFGPFMVFGWFVNGALSTVVYALWAGSVGTATQQLIHDQGADYAETFA